MTGTAADAPSMRVDKWLWHARFFKSRALAASCVGGGQLRINGIRAAKPAQQVRVGDVLTFAAGRHIRVVRVMAMSARRGPASEAQSLYADESPARASDAGAPKAEKGRPDRDARREARLYKTGPA